MAISRLNYTEPKQSTYRSIELIHHVNGKEETIYFDSGNVILDYFDYQRWLSNQEDGWYKENYRISGSSSWDHFFMDGERYHESYFDPQTGEFLDWRKAFDDHDFDRYKFITEKCPTVIHLKSQKNFAAVKAYCKKMGKNLDDSLVVSNKALIFAS